MTSIEALAITVGGMFVASDVLEGIMPNNNLNEIREGLEQAKSLMEMAINAYYTVDNPPEPLTEMFLDTVQMDKKLAREIEESNDILASRGNPKSDGR